MKWGEFKKAVEAAGVTDEMTVSFVDVYCPEAVEELRVEVESIEEVRSGLELTYPQGELPSPTVPERREFAVTN